jgi:hypothetical protein
MAASDGDLAKVKAELARSIAAAERRCTKRRATTAFRS